MLPGAAGSQQLEIVIQRAEEIYQSIEPYLEGSPSIRAGEFTIGTQFLQIQLTNLYQGQMVQYRAGRLRAADELSLWTNHLAANLFEPTPSILIARGNASKAETCRLEPLTQDDARQHLLDLLGYYERGMKSPLFLPCHASRTFVSSLMQDQDRELALARARAEWSNDQTVSEGDDRYWQRLFQFPEAFSGPFSSDACAVWEPLLATRHE